MPGNNMSGNALVNHPSSIVGATAFNSASESEATLERPCAKGNSEIFGPKGVWKPSVAPNRSPTQQDRVDKDKERLRGEVVASAILVDKVALLSVEDNDSEGPMSAANGAAPVALAT